MKKLTTSERLNQIMNERNIKQVDILEACKPYCKKYNVKLSKSDLSQYVSGTTIPRQDKLTILSFALKVNEVWLMGYDVPSEFGAFEKNGTEKDKTDLQNMIETQYGETSWQMFQQYHQLDLEDKAEIRGEIKAMLKSEKYAIQKEYANEQMR